MESWQTRRLRKDSLRILLHERDKKCYKHLSWKVCKQVCDTFSVSTYRFCSKRFDFEVIKRVLNPFFRWLYKFSRLMIIFFVIRFNFVCQLIYCKEKKSKLSQNKSCHKCLCFWFVSCLKCVCAFRSILLLLCSVRFFCWGS